MRNVVGQVVIAVLLFALGLAAWTVGRVQQRVADAHEQLAVLEYDALDAAYDDVEQSMQFANRVPWLTDAFLSDVREHRAAADYWRARYDGLVPAQGTNGQLVEQEAALATTAANAAFRAGQRESGDRQAALRRLDVALKSYASVLKKSPGDADVAYNYEFIVKMRDGLSKSRPPTPGKRDDSARALQKVAPPTAPGDLPDGRTVHGDPGAPPPNTDMTQFKMHIPIRPDERQGGSDAGQGKQKVRKG